MMNRFTLMCNKAKEIQDSWRPVIGDKVSILYEFEDKTSEVENCILQDSPAYGMGYEYFNDDNNHHKHDDGYFDINKVYNYQDCSGKCKLVDIVGFKYNLSSYPRTITIIL